MWSSKLLCILCNQSHDKNTKTSKMRKKWIGKCEPWTDDIDLFQDIKILA